MCSYLPSAYQQFIHLSRYSRWLHKEKRRETWPETVKRYFDFFTEHLLENCSYVLTPELRKELEEAVLNLEVVPSMRCLMTAGEALKRENISGYNCSYVAIDHPRAFDEILYVLMNGTGVGFSVERQYINKLPEIEEAFYDTDTTIVVADSKLGWSKALKELIGLLYTGQVPKWDLSRIRPAGSILKTFGGRASGPEPLEDLFKFCVRTFKNATGRKLNSIECHDIACKIGEVVVVGGVRRSACISLSNLSDDRMRVAKSGQWWIENNQRELANNSTAYTERPDVGIFIDEWKALYDSKSGERGIFNRTAAKKQAEKNGRRDPEYDFGTNPCSEIILRSRQLCNLSEIIVRPDDTWEDLKRKARLAAILGTFQSTLTNFKYVTKEWKRNCDEERLLGVSLTGIMDNFLLNGANSPNRLPDKDELQKVCDSVVETNLALAKELDIPQATATTCIKPSGTVSQLANCSSGIHARHSEYFLRAVRIDIKDPLFQFMKSVGFPWEEDVTKPASTAVFYFPMKSPENAILRNDRTAIEQLELWKVYQENWCEHKPSMTVYVNEDEWIEVAAWCYRNFDSISGISFFPNIEHIYRQAPYQDITEEEYHKYLEKMPKDVDWSLLSNIEEVDNTAGPQTSACSAGSCEVVDLT